MACLVRCMWVSTSTANQPYGVKRNKPTKRLGTGLNQHTEGLEAVVALSPGRGGKASPCLLLPLLPHSLPVPSPEPRAVVRNGSQCSEAVGWSQGLAVDGCYARGIRLSQDDTLQFVSAGGPVSSPFCLLFLLLVFLWNLLPNYSN